MREFGFQSADEERIAVAGLPNYYRRSSSNSDRTLLNRRQRNRDETVEEAFTKQLAKLRNSSLDQSIDSASSYEPSVFRPDTAAAHHNGTERFRKVTSDLDRFRQVSTNLVSVQKFSSPKVDLKIHLATDTVAPSIPDLGCKRFDDTFSAFDFSDGLKVPLNFEVLNDSGNRIGTHYVPFYDSEMSSEFEEKELDFKNQQKVLFPGTSQSRPRPGSGQEKRQGLLSYGPIVSSNDDRRRMPIRRTTVGPVETNGVGLMRQKSSEDKISKKKSTDSIPSTFELFDDGRVTRRQNPGLFSNAPPPTAANSRDIGSSLSSQSTNIRDIGSSMIPSNDQQHRRFTKRPGFNSEEGFFSYISPSLDEQDQPSHGSNSIKQVSKTTNSMERSRPSIKKLTKEIKEMEISEVDDLDLEDLGRLFVAKPPVGSVAGLKGEPISPELAIELKQLLFGNANRDFPVGWKGQAFEFNDRPMLKFGLVQHRGGPCGILAAVQAFILRFLIFPDDGKSETYDCNLEAKALSPISATRNEALCQALCHILTKCGKRDKRVGLGEVVVAIPGSRSHFQGFPGKYKSDGVTETVSTFRFPEDEYVPGEFANLRNFIEHQIQYFSGKGNSGVIAFLYSAILTRGINTIKEEDMDSSEVPMMGAHGYCSQEMVNLLLTGSATSNTFDGHKNFDTLVLKGITEPTDIGLLSLFEHYGSCVVGDFLKTPNFPIWVVCSESHFTVVFSLQRGAEKTSTADRQIVELIYYDELGRQDEPVYIDIECSAVEHFFPKNETNISPIEHCLRTKWNDAKIHWKNGDPIL